MEEHFNESVDSLTARDREKSIVSLPVFAKMELNQASENSTVGNGKQNDGGSSFFDLNNNMNLPRMLMFLWLVDILRISRYPSKNRALKPFVVTYDLVKSRQPPVTNMLYTIAEWLRMKNYRLRTFPRRRLDALSYRCLADLVPGMKIPTHLLIQSCVDLLLLHGAMDNCYVFLMQCGGDEDCADAPMIVRKKSGIVQRCIQTGKSKEEKKLSQWNKLYAQINAPTPGMSEITIDVRDEHKPDSSFAHINAPTLDISEITVDVSLEHKLDSSIALQSKLMMPNATTNPNNDTEYDNKLAMEVGVDAKGEVDETVEKKKKKKGLKKMLKGSVRWINGKKKNSNAEIKPSKSKKMKKIFLSRKGDNKMLKYIVVSASNSGCSLDSGCDSKEKLNDIAVSASSSSCSLNIQFGCDSKEKLVPSNASSNDSSRDVSPDNVERQEDPPVTDAPKKVKKSFKSKITRKLGLTKKKSSSKPTPNAPNQAVTDEASTPKSETSKKEKIIKNKTEEKHQTDDKKNDSSAEGLKKTTEVTAKCDSKKNKKEKIKKNKTEEIDQDDGKKKENSGLKKKVSKPFRWIKKKF